MILKLIIIKKNYVVMLLRCYHVCSLGMSCMIAVIITVPHSSNPYFQPVLSYTSSIQIHSKPH